MNTSSADRPLAAVADATLALQVQFDTTRSFSLELVRPLALEDYGVQPMPDASPPKWHLAHTTWFFETFVLRPLAPGYQVFASQYEYLFNSYYNGVGAQFPRDQRGNLSRPTVAEVLSYRAHVDAAMQGLIAQVASGELATHAGDIAQRTLLGIHHEQQHQELLLTDLKYNLGHNPLYPAYRELPGRPRDTTAPSVSVTNFVEYPGGQITVGASGGFCFDNETPRHDVLLRDYALSDQLVSNGDYLGFIQAGGYQRSEFWLASAWALLNTQGWQAPLYWVEQDGAWSEYHLDGLAPLDMQAPVCHLSFYEAEAYARFAQARLPTEFEWEHAASTQPIVGNFADSAPGVAEVGGSKSGASNSGASRLGALKPLPPSKTQQPLHSLFGDLWEWTMSSYGPYPGYQPLPGTLGEYNGKFMSEQVVLRGGSCFSSAKHIRSSYRNFFYPPDRWQMSGVRLARDL